jgi:hypothetical protein
VVALEYVEHESSEFQGELAALVIRYLLADA